MRYHSGRIQQKNYSIIKQYLIREIDTCPIILCLRTFSLSSILIATFSPVSTFRANFTFAKVPSPSVRPSSYFPTRVLLLDREAIVLLLFPDPFSKTPLLSSRIPTQTSRSLLLTRLPNLRLGHTHLSISEINKRTLNVNHSLNLRLMTSY